MPSENKTITFRMLKEIETHEFIDKDLKSCRESLRRAISDGRYMVTQLKKIMSLNDEYEKTIKHIRTCDSIDCMRAWAKKAIPMTAKRK